MGETALDLKKVSQKTKTRKFLYNGTYDFDSTGFFQGFFPVLSIGTCVETVKSSRNKSFPELFPSPSGTSAKTVENSLKQSLRKIKSDKSG